MVSQERIEAAHRLWEIFQQRERIMKKLDDAGVEWREGPAQGMQSLILDLIGYPESIRNDISDMLSDLAREGEVSYLDDNNKRVIFTEFESFLEYLNIDIEKEIRAGSYVDPLGN